MIDTSKDIIISFDFDDTVGLTHWEKNGVFAKLDENGNHLQTPHHVLVEKINELRSKGIHVIIVSSRSDRFKEDIFEKLTSWGVEVDGVHCTNGKFKRETLEKLEVSIHFDNDPDELIELSTSKVLGVLVCTPNVL